MKQDFLPSPLEFGLPDFGIVNTMARDKAVEFFLNSGTIIQGVILSLRNLGI